MYKVVIQLLICLNRILQKLVKYVFACPEKIWLVRQRWLFSNRITIVIARLQKAWLCLTIQCMLKTLDTATTIKTSLVKFCIYVRVGINTTHNPYYFSICKLR